MAGFLLGAIEGGERGGQAASLRNTHQGVAGNAENNRPVGRPRAAAECSLKIAQRLHSTARYFHFLQFAVGGDPDEAAVARPEDAIAMVSIPSVPGNARAASVSNERIHNSV